MACALQDSMATASREAHATADDVPSRAARDAGRHGRPPLLPGAVQRLCQGAYQPPRAVLCQASRAISGPCAGAQESLHTIAPPGQEGEQIYKSLWHNRLQCQSEQRYDGSPFKLRNFGEGIA